MILGHRLFRRKVAEQSALVIVISALFRYPTKDFFSNLFIVPGRDSSLDASLKAGAAR